MEGNKRSNADFSHSNNEIVKKQKLEACPHALKCYRRNPHHFKEYDHPHLNEFLETTSPKFPNSFKQEHTVYLEQLEILRELKKIKLNASQPVNIEQKEEAKPKTSRSVQEVIKATTSSFFNKNKTTAHSHKNIVPNKMDLKGKKVLKNAKTMKEKLEICAPYNLFFTKVPEAAKTMNGYNCISFPDLICPSIGILEKSLQLNFMIDVSWLIEQYQVHNLHTTPLTIVYGYDFPMMKEYIAKNLPNVTPHQVNLKDPFGIHHSKIGIYKFENDIIRIVVSTANLYYEDWNHYNQGLWLSPPLSKMDAAKQDFECAGPTGFKTDFLAYLKSYNLDVLRQWIEIIKRTDFSPIKVYFVSSIPGRHYPRNNGSHVHRVGDLLSKHCSLPVKTTPDSEGALSWGVIAQSSSLGSFGKSAGDWLRPVLLRALASHKNSVLPATPKATLSLIYPTVKNVLGSHFGPQGGGCLPYGKSVNDKQKWLKEYLHVWKADTTGRSRAMPHIKSYVRVSPCMTKLAWCLITSANISKAAWGGNSNRDGGTYIRSYEAGIMFLPHMFEEEYFYIERKEGDEGHLFPLMYDLPLEAYQSADEPWCN